MLITVSNGPTLSALFTMFVIVQTIYGIGVGGEYPVASSSANERANSYKCAPLSGCAAAVITRSSNAFASPSSLASCGC